MFVLASAHFCEKMIEILICIYAILVILAHLQRFFAIKNILVIRYNFHLYVDLV